MQINNISSMYFNRNNKIQNFKAKREIQTSTQEQNEDKKQSAREKAVQLAAIAGILGFALAFDFIQKKYSNGIVNNEEPPALITNVTNDTFQISKDMEDTYQTVLSNKLKRAEKNLPKIEFYRIKEGLRRLDKISKTSVDLGS